MCRTLVSIGLAFSLAVIPSAAAPRTRDAAKPLRYFPTTVGTRAVYQAFGGEVTEAVTAVEQKDDAIFVTVEASLPGKGEPMRSKVQVTSSGVFRAAVGDTQFDPPCCLLRLPPEVASKWEFEVPDPPGVANVKWTAVITGEEVREVPAGKFNTVRVDYEFIDSNDKPVRSTAWYAAEIGMVKSSYGADQPTVLKSFSAGKK